MTELLAQWDADEITEVLIQDFSECWIEKLGTLSLQTSPWKNENDYRQFVRALLDRLNMDLSLQDPFCSGRVEGFRVQIVGPPVVSSPSVALRKIRSHPVSLKDWMGESDRSAQILAELVQSRSNIMVYGSTGSGKTTLLSSLLSEVAPNQRVVMLEDTEELIVPNTLSLRLLSRVDPNGVMREISLSDLVKHSLRLRPDRLALGEVRGPEAKDLLMALATGHKGSLGTLHALNANEALLRLEMLVQLGAPQWQTQAIRQLILLSVNHIVGVRRREDGKRVISEIHKLCGVENFGFLMEKL